MKTITKTPFRRTPACIALVLLASFFLNGCSENEKPEPELQKELPVIVTSSVSEITENSAKTGGNITSDGGAVVTAKGVVWGTSPNPTIADSKTTNGSGAGEFVAELIALEASTTYYVRAYATNSEGTAYGDPVSFETTSEESTNPYLNPNLTYGSVTDIDGNKYATIKIGDQTWMAENLRTTKYNDGIVIPYIAGSAEWSGWIRGGYCAYTYNNLDFKSTYGMLYNWYAVNTGKLCPAGWHIPTIAEWDQFTTYLGSNAAGKMKPPGNSSDGTGLWSTPNKEATNESGFTALPGGSRNQYAKFTNIGDFGFWWSTTENAATPTTARLVFIHYYDWGSYGKNTFTKTSGLSCRCIKD